MKPVEAQAGDMETRLRQWGAKLDELRAKADEAGADAKVDYHQQLDELKSKHQVAQAKLLEFKAAGDEKWEFLKTGIEGAFNELELAWKNIKS